MTTVEPVELLIVEDNPNDLELALRALRKTSQAQKIYTVSDGAEALDFVFCRGPYAERSLNLHPKVILLDLKLPKLGGLEVLRQIRAHEKTKVIPIVVLTSSQQESDIRESYLLGANSYIVKPIDFAKFSVEVAHLATYWLSMNQPPH